MLAGFFGFNDFCNDTKLNITKIHKFFVIFTVKAHFQYKCGKEYLVNL